MRSDITQWTLAVVFLITATAYGQAQRPAAAQPPVPVPVGPAGPAIVPPQPWVAPPAVLQPANISRTAVLGDLVLAKLDIDDDGARVIMMIESFRTEKKSVTVTRIVNETREREIEVDGKQTTEQYVVQVPVSEEREMSEHVPAGRKPTTIDAGEMQFYNLNAEPITVDEVAKKLTSLQPIFLIDRTGSPPLPLPELAKRALREHCLIAVTKKKIRAFAQPRTVWWPAPAFAPAAPVVPGPPVLRKQDLPQREPIAE